MDYRASLTIPKSTPKGSPTTQEVALVRGTITRIRIRIPAGHHGLAHIRILRFGGHFYPTTRGTYYQGDDEVIVIDDRYSLEAEPLVLVLEGYNDDDTYAHTFELSVTLQAPVPEIMPPSDAAAVFAALGA